MAWKVQLFIKLTLGYWDEALIKAMEIKEVAQKYDEDPDDDSARDGDTVRIMGVSRSRRL